MRWEAQGNFLMNFKFKWKASVERNTKHHVLILNNETLSCPPLWICHKNGINDSFWCGLHPTDPWNAIGRDRFVIISLWGRQIYKLQRICTQDVLTQNITHTCDKYEWDVCLLRKHDSHDWSLFSTTITLPLQEHMVDGLHILICLQHFLIWSDLP